jgi:hypothetical protein
MYYSYSISPVLVPKEDGIWYSIIPVYTENGSPSYGIPFTGTNTKPYIATFNTAFPDERLCVFKKWSGRGTFSKLICNIFRGKTHTFHVQLVWSGGKHFSMNSFFLRI